MNHETVSQTYEDTVKLLERLQVGFRVYQHEDVPITDYVSDQLARERYQMLGHPTKSVLVMEKGTGRPLVLLTLPEKRRVDWKRLASESDLAKLSIATAEQLMAHTGCPPGTLVPIGLAREITIYLDEDLKTYDRILLSIACMTTRSLEIPTNELERIFAALPNAHYWTRVATLD